MTLIHLNALAIGLLLWPLTFTWLCYQKQMLSQGRTIR